MIFDSQLTCVHKLIHLVYLKNSTSIRCKSCAGVLGEYRNDVPEAATLDKLIYRRLYIFGKPFTLTDKELAQWR